MSGLTSGRMCWQAIPLQIMANSWPSPSHRGQVHFHFSQGTLLWSYSPSAWVSACCIINSQCTCGINETLRVIKKIFSLTLVSVKSKSRAEGSRLIRKNLFTSFRLSTYICGISIWILFKTGWTVSSVFMRHNWQIIRKFAVWFYIHIVKTFSHVVD